MAVTKDRQRVPTRDFLLVYHTAETPGATIRSAFRSKWDWVISCHHSTPARYATVVSNLQRSYVEPEKATIDLIRNLIAHGLDREAFNRLKTILAIPGTALSQVVRIPARTLARRDVFKPDESERILRVASAFQKALEVLGSLDKARRWFANPKRALGEKTPLEFCDTDPGTEEVIHLLGRIEHGVFT